MDNELTVEETVQYANYGLVDICDLCGYYFSILNSHDNRNYLTWEKNRLYCRMCMVREEKI